MNKFISHALNLLILAIVSSFGFMSYVSAITSPMHQMEHEAIITNYVQPGSSDFCASLCTTAVIDRKDRDTSPLEDKDDDDPVAPFYLLQPPLIYDSTSLKGSSFVFSLEPPPKVPIYILYSVFRV